MILIDVTKKREPDEEEVKKSSRIYSLIWEGGIFWAFDLYDGRESMNP